MVIELHSVVVPPILGLTIRGMFYWIWAMKVFRVLVLSSTAATRTIPGAIEVKLIPKAAPAPRSIEYSPMN
jgi:hypothetical protein